MKHFVKIKHFIMSAVIMVIAAACVEKEDYTIASVSIGDVQLLNSSEGQVTATYSIEVGHTWNDLMDLFIAWAKDPKDLVRQTELGDGWASSDWVGNVIDGTYESISFQKSESGTVTFKIPLNKLTPSMTYYVRACIDFNRIEEYYHYHSDIKSFTIAAESLEPVDLGLSVEWATCNLGAANPKERGSSYTWGDPENGERSGWSAYKWANGYENTLTKYCNNDQYGRVDNLYILEKEDDAAYVQTEGLWRIPTPSEWEELMKKCSWYYDSSIGSYIVSKSGESIVLPAGDYWTNELFTELGGIRAANAIYAGIRNYKSTGQSSRCNRYMIRAVRDKK